MTDHKFDVVVLGGGVIGCSVAYHLARQKARVLVLDKHSLGGQASSVAAGMLAAQEEANGPGPFLDACLASRNLFATLAPELHEHTGIDPEWDPCGVWRAAADEDDAARLQEKVRWQTGLGLRAEWLSPDDVAHALPGLGPSAGALRCPLDGQVHTGKWVKALAEGARRLGVRFVDHAADPVLARDGDRVIGVKTQTELFTADKTVVALGAWTGPLLKGLGLDLLLEPVKGQLMVLSGLPRAFPAPVYAGAGYLVPKADGRLIVGATSEKAGFHTRPTLAGQRALAEWAARWVTGLPGLPVLELQAGLRPGTADGLPILGPVPGVRDLYVCAGHHRNGILLSPWSGRYMATGLLHDHWDPLGHAFLPGRLLNAPAVP